MKSSRGTSGWAGGARRLVEGERRSKTKIETAVGGVFQPLGNRSCTCSVKQFHLIHTHVKLVAPSLCKCLELCLSYLSLTFTEATRGHQHELVEAPTHYPQAVECLLTTHYSRSFLLVWHTTDFHVAPRPRLSSLLALTCPHNNLHIDAHFKMRKLGLQRQQVQG